MAACLLTPAAASAALAAIDDDGYYFVNDFEDNVPPSSPGEETAIYVDGEGEWLFLKSFVSTNSSYVRSGEYYISLVTSLPISLATYVSIYLIENHFRMQFKLFLDNPSSCPAMSFPFQSPCFS